MRTKVDSQSPTSPDYQITLEEYKLLLNWTNDIANRRQETSNLFFGVSGAILTVVGLALTQSKSSERFFALLLASVIGIAVTIIWASLLGRYREILRFKYTQLELFEEVLGLENCGLVSAEDRYFKYRQPLGIPGKPARLPPLPKARKFGVTLAESSLAWVFLFAFSVVIITTIIGYILGRI